MAKSVNSGKVTELRTTEINLYRLEGVGLEHNLLAPSEAKDF